MVGHPRKDNNGMFNKISGNAHDPGMILFKTTAIDDQYS